MREIKVNSSDQDKKTLQNLNPVERLGEYAVTGGPGRPQGLKNRFTMIKQDMLEVWEEEGGKERFRELFRGSKSDFLKALEKLIAILPKEQVIGASDESLSDRVLKLLQSHGESEDRVVIK